MGQSNAKASIWLKMLKMAQFDVIMTSHVEIASHCNLKSASIVMLDISPWD